MSDSNVPTPSDSNIPSRSDADNYERWVSIYNTNEDYDADLVRDRLDDAGLPAVILTQRDHSFNVGIGDLARVHVMVPPEHAEEAREHLNSEPFTDAELTEAALNADPDTGDAHGGEMEAMLDSAIDEINLSLPDEVANDAGDSKRAAQERRAHGQK